MASGDPLAGGQPALWKRLPPLPRSGRPVFLGPGVTDCLEVSQALLSIRSPASVWQEGPAWGPLGDSDPRWMKEDTCSPHWPGALCIFTLRGNLNP